MTRAHSLPTWMPEAISAALAQDGLGWLILGTFIAGVVRGFTGFGTALIFLPVAGQFVAPVWALITLLVMDVIGSAPNIPRAMRDGQPGQVAWMLLGGLVALPLGLFVLFAVRPEVFRYVVSVIALVAPVLMAAGFRLHRPMTRPLLVGTGAASGFLGGVSGLAGPPVILLWMATARPTQVIRGNILSYLSVFAVITMGVLAAQGRLEGAPVVLGLVLAGPNLLGNLAGAAMFRPERARIYRAAGYVITAGSALLGLPLWD